MITRLHPGLPRRLVLVALCATSVISWTDPLSSQFTSGVSLVEVYATVIDKDGNPLTGLTKDDFTVFEDGERQAVSAFAAGEFALSVAIGLDRSFSVGAGRLAQVKQAVRQFVDELKPGDRTMILAIGSTVDVAAPLDASRLDLLHALDGIDVWGTTALHDSIVAGIDRIQPEPGRRALVLISDGTDRYSQASAADAVQRARAADVLLYPVALGRTRPPLFAELAVLTGGRSATVREMPELGPTLASIASELRTQYLLGYTPARPMKPDDNEWRSIRVEVSRPGVHVRARDGYLAK